MASQPSLTIPNVIHYDTGHSQAATPDKYLWPGRIGEHRCDHLGPVCKERISLRKGSSQLTLQQCQSQLLQLTLWYPEHAHARTQAQTHIQNILFPLYPKEILMTHDPTNPHTNAMGDNPSHFQSLHSAVRYWPLSPGPLVYIHSFSVLSWCHLSILQPMDYVVNSTIT